MDLFNQLEAQPLPLIETDGLVLYYGVLLPENDADAYLDYLLSSIEWRHDEAIIFGKHITTRRKVAWYAEQPFEYTYSKTTKTALPFTPQLSKLKTLVEAATNEHYNSCLLNLYHDGSEGMAWHSDAETDLKKHGAIASLSFGAKRKFSFRHKVSKALVSASLQHGSLLVMKGVTQTHWLHCLPTSRKVCSPRVNLTFRTIVSNSDC